MIGGYAMRRMEKELTDRIRVLEAANAELLALVEQVEWYASMIYRCPWCRWFSTDGHAPGCPRQAALAKVKGKAR